MSSNPQTFDLVIVGGGAAGFFAAITCLEYPRPSGSAPLRILILEKNRHPLGKVQVSGGGRCNLSHACVDPAELVENYPRGKAELPSAFSRFNTTDTINWFETHGVALKTESDGRVFPISDNSQSIVDLLLNTANQNGVKVWTEVITKSIEMIERSSMETSEEPGSINHARFRIRLKSGSSDPGEGNLEMLSTRCILFATGGDISSMNLAKSIGHTIQQPVPSLFTFTISDPRLEGLAGLSVGGVSLRLENQANDKQSTSCRIDATGQDSLVDQKIQKQQGQRLSTNLEQQGAVLITHWGLSGPAVLRLSAWGARWLHKRSYQALLIINWMYPLSSNQVLETLKNLRAGKGQFKSTSLKSHKVSAFDPIHHLPQRLWQRLVQAAGIDASNNWADLSNPALQRLVDELTSGRFLMRGKGPYKEEFVTCGGVCLDEVNFKTMESKLTPGLFFAGEILDIDGLTGGFNLQNAWTTGWIAGVGVAKSSYYRGAE